jgi:glycosyltransferase involved in cell wall biosynthesis
MTSYNREVYIGAAVESVLASTFGNFELIISDDRSKDGTLEIARSYEKQDRRVRVHLNEANLGDYPNRRQAAALSRGRWLKYVDSDDYLYPTGLQVMMDMMGRFPEAGYGLCSIRQMDEGPFPLCLSPVEAYRQHYFRGSIFHKAPLSAIIRREVWDAVGGFSGEDIIGDFDMWHRLSYAHDVVLMPFGIVWYRKHEGQVTVGSQKDPLERRLQYQGVIKRHLPAPGNPLTAQERVTIARGRSAENRRLALRRLAAGDLGGCGRLLAEAGEFAAIARSLAA